MAGQDQRRSSSVVRCPSPLAAASAVRAGSRMMNERKPGRGQRTTGDGQRTMPRYLIGIDLGTTNSALAYVDLKRKPSAGRPEIHTFAVPQLTAPGEVSHRPLLPSFLYLPGPHDLPAGSTALPWDPERSYAVGE